MSYVIHGPKAVDRALKVLNFLCPKCGELLNGGDPVINSITTQIKLDYSCTACRADVSLVYELHALKLED